MQNDAGDYEIRNKIFKGMVGQKRSITTIINGSNETVLVFEWFFDFLSYATQFQKTRSEQSFIILNSVTWKKETIEKINQLKPTTVKFYFDNDEAW